MSTEGRNEAIDWSWELLRDNNLVHKDNEIIDYMTFQEPQQGPLPQAKYIDDLVLYEGKVFNNDDEPYNFYGWFARKNGFSTRRHHVYKSIKNKSEDNPLGIYKREFVCHRAGTMNPQKDNEVEAIAMELPNTKHAFCIWHILAKLSTWFSFPLGSRYNDFKYEFHRLYHLGCADDFEREWKFMVTEFGLSKDNHIKLLYLHRQFWALAYMKDFFFARMTTTGRSESINSYIKRFLGAKTSLTDFINQVGVAVKIINQAREESRMRQKYPNPHIRTCFPIEEHAASILTHYSFRLLQQEIELSTKYVATETNNNLYIVRHHTNN